ncbi:Ribosomal RNA small subunit methyltransferase D [Aquimixticola soesokkakensis]|uniref:Ribosomal RNA small subunit methyltransferase D n=1 Tax=Aquimixticola soesokkakensis TaxID=1519096 RepID=A0A1Y5RG07_9RHOB|nr:16S rRNA (guanine(966)-N(2))-methyltransferase RsmD [Aquimixticola soesokkakensis]SLN16644.1 Ribosomal RNA small subunit methyltransferase D [Aquimixticola soesokkakensis]
MRIIAGLHRGRALTPVGKGDPAAHLRPTTDRVRESLFNVLNGGRFGAPLEGAVVLDLFAGTGALGLEALSRGAAQVTFVEDGRKAQSLVSANITLLKAQTQTSLLRCDATRLPANSGAPATLVFLDPPYAKGLGEKAVASALAGGWVAQGALVVWEDSANIVPPPELDLLDARRYGDTTISLLERL